MDFGLAGIYQDGLDKLPSLAMVLEGHEFSSDPAPGIGGKKDESSHLHFYENER
jgi:hypothetical protein